MWTHLHTHEHAHTLPTHIWCSASPPSQARAVLQKHTSGYQGDSYDTPLHPCLRGWEPATTLEFSESTAIYHKCRNPSRCMHNSQGATCQAHCSRWGRIYRDIYSLYMGYRPLIQNAWPQKWYGFLIVSELGILAEIYLVVVAQV